MTKNPANQGPEPQPNPQPGPQQQGAEGKPPVHQLSPNQHAEVVKLIRATDPDVAHFNRDKGGGRKTTGK